MKLSAVQVLIDRTEDGSTFLPPHTAFARIPLPIHISQLRLLQHIKYHHGLALHAPMNRTLGDAMDVAMARILSAAGVSRIQSHLLLSYIAYQSHDTQQRL